MPESVRSDPGRGRTVDGRVQGRTVEYHSNRHSLGAALEILAADELSSIEGIPPIAVISFGGPRVGNYAFADRVTDRMVKVLRVVTQGT